MEQYLESIIITGKTSQLPTPSSVIDQQCELFKSRRVTGILLCGQGHFMAVLEGQPLVLQSVMKQNIKNVDTLQIIHQTKIPQRGYRYWNIHIAEGLQASTQNEADINKILAKNYPIDKEQSSYQLIKNIVAYYYCEYIVSSFNCNDYRLANIA